MNKIIIIYGWLKELFHYLINNELRDFLKKNTQFWKSVKNNSPDRNRSVILSEGSFGFDYWNLVIATTSTIVAKALGLPILYLFDDEVKASPVKKMILNSFYKHYSFICINTYLSDNEKQIVKAEASRIYESLKNPEEILKIQWHGVPTGEQIYDAVIKYRHASVWKLDNRVLEKIQHALRTQMAVEKILNQYDVRAGTFPHTTTTFTGVAVRVLLKRKIPVFQGFGGFGALYRYNELLNEEGHLNEHIMIPVAILNEMINTQKEKLLKKANDYIDERMRGTINDWDALRAYSPEKKIYTDKEEFCLDFGLDKTKPNVFIMLHAMNDDPHIHGNSIFNDYYDWFIRTLKLTRKITAVNWIFKQHPMIKFYPDDSNLKGIFEIIEKEIHIKYLDETTPLNSASIPNIAHAVVTCAGTAGLEFACHGIPAILAAENGYSLHNICNKPKSWEEYKTCIEQIKNIKPPDMQIIEKARILFYLMYRVLIPGYRVGFFPDLNMDQMMDLNKNGLIAVHIKNFFQKTDIQKDFNSIKAMMDFINSTTPGEKDDVFINFH